MAGRRDHRRRKVQHQHQQLQLDDQRLLGRIRYNCEGHWGHLGSFGAIWGPFLTHFSRISQLHAAPHVPCDHKLYFVLMRVGHRLGLQSDVGRSSSSRPLSWVETGSNFSILEPNFGFGFWTSQDEGTRQLKSNVCVSVLLTFQALRWLRRWLSSRRSTAASCRTVRHTARR